MDYQITENSVFGEVLLDVEESLINTFEKVLGLQRADLDEKITFKELGVGSINAVELLEAINNKFDLSLPTSIIFECANLEGLASYIAEIVQDSRKQQKASAVQTARIEAEENIGRTEKNCAKKVSEYSGNGADEAFDSKRYRVREPDDIAVIGLSCRCAGADGQDAFWDIISQGKNRTREITDKSWLEYFRANSPGSVPGRYGAMEGIEFFDPMFFNISAIEADSMDVQQRILLEECYRALEDSGYTPTQLRGQAVGTYMGTMGQSSTAPDFSHYAMLGYDSSIMAARIAYYLDLKGPALALNTACSSSLVAIDIACQQLRNLDIDLAISGGISVYTHPGAFISMNNAKMLSPTGECRPFDNNANGIIVGDGVGVVILKRLKEAVRDNDYIYGVIKGIGINQDGQTSGITAPSFLSQSQLQESVYRRNGIHVEDIQYIEAHGTATKLGDPVEIHALTNTFNKFTSKKRFCAIGSVKANIGHTTAAAGVLSLIKVLLSLKYKQIPPSINFEKGNEHIDFDNSPVYVNTALKEWTPNSRGTRLAAVSAFGFSGTNAHVVIEDYPERGMIPDNRSGEPVPGLLLLSAQKEEGLQAYAKKVADYMKQNRYIPLSNILYTLQVGREGMNYRLALLAGSKEMLISQLEQFAQSGTLKADNIYTGKAGKKEGINISDTEEGREFIQNLIRNRKLKKLAELWVNGNQINWTSLYENSLVKRLGGLPTYPFAKESYSLPSIPSTRTHVRVKGLKLRENAEHTAHTYAGTELQSTPEDNLPEPFELMTFKEIWQEQALPVLVHAEIKTLVCFISDREKQQEAAETVKAINKNAEVIFVSQGAGFEIHSKHAYSVSRTDGSAYKSVFESIRKDYGETDAILYLWTLEDASCIQDYACMVYILQAAAASEIKPRWIIAAAQYDNGLNGCYPESWIGFERSYGLVQPNTQIAVVFQEVETNNPSIKEWIQRLLAEMQMHKLQSAMYRNGKRHICCIQPARTEPGESLLKPGGTYMITGGCGALGMLVAEHLAKTYPVNLILVGRSPYSAEKQSKIKLLEAIGSQALYIQADVCDRSGMEKSLSLAKERFGKINGVIHTAGHKSNQNIFVKKMEDFQKVLDPKVKGTLILDEILQQEELDFVCYFSSSSAIMGDFGSCDYAVANRFQMAYATYRSRWCPGRTFVINWPLWENGGMGFEDGENSKIYLKSSGQRLLGNEEGLSIFDRILSQNDTQHLVLVGRPSRIRRFLGLVPEAEAAPARSFISPKNKKRRVEMDGFSMEKSLELDLKKMVAKILKISKDKLDMEKNLADFGFDSISLADFASLLTGYYGFEIVPGVFYGHSTLEKLGQYFLTEHNEAIREFYSENEWVQDTPQKVQAPAAAAEVEHPKRRRFTEERAFQSAAEPIAVIGMSGRFPSADNVEELWEKIQSGKECITDIPADRWNLEEFCKDFTDEPVEIRCNRGGFVSDIDRFDSLFFNISPKEAVAMDPKQRLFLEEAWHTLEDAGYMGERIKGKSCGVYVGVEESEYGYLSGRSGSINSNQNATLSARIAYALDLRGPNMALTAACSSGLVAIHQACQALRQGECEMALAGGVSLMISPAVYVGLSKADMLSPDGESYVFDRRANGMVPGEAAAAVLLKPLSKAIADKDYIYGCIKASGVNYSGKTNGITAPSPVAQAELFEDIYRKYNIKPENIQFVLAHSVGSKLGDCIEVQALTSAFRKYTHQKQYCAIGSLKPLIGHTFAASGVVSLIGMLMAMKNKAIPALLHYESNNEYINFLESPFIVNKENVEWTVKNGQPRLGVISTTGISGTNAHAVIEEYTGSFSEADNTQTVASPQIVVFSARNQDRLQTVVQRVCEYVERRQEISLSDLAYTLQVGREPMEHRMAMLASSRDEMIRGMREYLSSCKEVEASIPIFTGNLTGSSTGVRSTLFGKLEGIMIQALLSEKDMEKIALFWTQGGRIPWEVLHEGEKVQRIPIPTYPFEKHRYWVESKAQRRAASDQSKQADDAAARGFSVAVSDSLDSRITGIISSILGLVPGELNLDMPLERYGIDSIIQMQLIKQLQAKIDASVNPAMLRESRTIQDIINALQKNISEGVLQEQHKGICLPTGRPDFPELIHLNRNTVGRPVFWFHPMQGGVEVYQAIAGKIGRPFFGIQARGWMSDVYPICGLHAMASYYLQIIRSVQPEGPYDVGGFSLGGVIAYEITRQLQELGQTVNTITMLDSIYTPKAYGSKETAGTRPDLKTTALQAVNMALLSLYKPQKVSEVLIHHDDLNTHEEDEVFIKQLIALAQKRGLSKTESQLQKLIASSAKIQQCYQGASFDVLPLVEPKAVTCHYFRNKSGVFLGELEPYFTIENSTTNLEGIRYWEQWEKQIPAFHMRDVDSSNHMMILSEPQALSTIVEFCENLYAKREIST
ncbi:MAG TPA: SDR family NAD(P)-dependent oxidoreductase [Clostridia bacterium]|nr:SDR family NAD(P)-dependent oxidoreductase [Clostridia bacterium]